MIYNPDLVAVINTITGILFFGLLAVGAVRTIGRVVYYRRHQTDRPRLLTRDAIFFGGLAGTFALILAVRVLGLASLVVGNVVWAVVTDAAALIAVGTYTYYELFVIERPQ